MADVHVKPTLGAALFFSYVDPETLKMDDGLTQHSGCPVYKGDKKIVTQWIRDGVDAENRFFLFDDGKRLTDGGENSFVTNEVLSYQKC